MNGHNVDISQVTGQATVASTGTSILLFGLSVSEVAVVISAVIAVLTFALHVWYTVRKDKREAEAARLSIIDKEDGSEDAEDGPGP